MNYKNKLHKIKAFIFDFDGVMTDGSVWVFADKETVRAGNIKDGYAIQYAVKKGYKIAVISGATSLSINNRMESLGVTDIFTGAGNKITVFEKYLEDNNLLPEEVLYMGDDIPDYEIMKRVGVATCPADAAVEIKEIADYISLFKGGFGCVRDVIEQVLKLHNNWFHKDAVHW
ncbi:MAG: HAD hydrolase-like protein [Bacteroidales bacterium]|nr:HAD hydrolase-like protein [Bacteroidales bacterium]